MSDPQNRAEELDGEVLGEQPGNDELPGVNAFTDDHERLNVEDPSVQLGSTETDDGMGLRNWRQRPDERPGAADRPMDGRSDEERRSGLRLTDDDSDVPSLADHEKDLVADASMRPDDDELSAEEAALHVEGDPSDDTGIAR